MLGILKFMNKEELFSVADNLKKEGDFLLRDSKLIETLSQFGGVHISGAYSVNLMMHGDIDLYVVLGECTQEKVLEILNVLIRENYFRGFYYGDYIKYPKDGFPKGYYIGLNTMHNNAFWKFDLWFIDKVDEEKDTYMKFIEENLTDETRYEILKRKKERNDT